jgi:hypothetical protein
LTRQLTNNRFACSDIAKFVRLAGKKRPIHFNRRFKTRPTRGFNPPYGLSCNAAAISKQNRLLLQHAYDDREIRFFAGGGHRCAHLTLLVIGICLKSQSDLFDVESLELKLTHFPPPSHRCRQG